MNRLKDGTLTAYICPRCNAKSTDETGLEVGDNITVQIR